VEYDDMMFGRKVRVRFLPADGGPPIGEATFAPEQLPESFEARTTLELGGQSWEVVKADPVTRAEYSKTRRLTIVMRKIEVSRVPVGDILYSLPTICDGLPGIAAGSSKLGKNVLALHEDDWRQFEFVSTKLRTVVDEQLGHIRRILDSRTGPGFKEIHVRSELTSPLIDCHVARAVLERAFPDARAFDGIAFNDAAGVVANGFAIDTGDVTVYGVVDDGLVTTLALQRPKGGLPGAIAALSKEHGLLLVDWCSAKIVDP
jgi:hypothetical protein